jgi:hypothetical protein
MKAEDVRLTHLLEGPKQFIVPVFQRDYSWGTKHCVDDAMHLSPCLSSFICACLTQTFDLIPVGIWPLVQIEHRPQFR